jgi:hypothetical protein
MYFTYILALTGKKISVMVKDDCNSRNSWSRQMFSIALMHISDIYKKYKKYIRSFSFYTILLLLQETEEAQL